MSTPFEEVADVLQSKGYVLVDDRPPGMVFTKGAPEEFHSLPGSAGFVYRVMDSDQQRTIFLQRPPTKEWKVAAASGEPWTKGRARKHRMLRSEKR